MTTISPGYHGEDVAVADAPGINSWKCKQNRQQVQPR